VGIAIAKPTKPLKFKTMVGFASLYPPYKYLYLMGPDSREVNGQALNAQD